MTRWGETLSSRMPSPTIYVIAGCNGAGKTTFAKEFLPHEVKCLRFYNADEIARGLSPLDPSAGAIKAGRLLLSEVRDSIDYLPLATRLGALGQSRTPRETAGDIGD